MCMSMYTHAITCEEIAYMLLHEHMHEDMHTDKAPSICIRIRDEDVCLSVFDSHAYVVSCAFKLQLLDAGNSLEQLIALALA